MNKKLNQLEGWQLLTLEERMPHIENALKSYSFTRADGIYANIDVVDDNGDTPLSSIARNLYPNGYTKRLIETLIEAGANINYRNPTDGVTVKTASRVTTGQRGLSAEEIDELLESAVTKLKSKGIGTGK